MAKISIDTKKSIAIIDFDKSEERLAKLLLTFTNKDALVQSKLDALLKKAGAITVKLDLKHSSVSKETVLALLDK